MKAIKIFGLLGLLIVLVGCPDDDSGDANEETARNLHPDYNVVSCFTVNTVPAAQPHTEVGNRFCTEMEENVLILVPGVGMEEWTPCDGASSIVLTYENGPRYTFCVLVDGHTFPEDDVHEPKHTNFQILIFKPKPNLPADKDQEARIVGIGGGPGSKAHGGTAHSSG